MNYKDALTKFSQYYKDRYFIEFPTIFNLCNLRNKKVLEVGSGRKSYFLKELFKLTKNVVASDISNEILKELKRKIRIKTKVCSAEKLPFSNKSFDTVLSRWVVQDINNLERAVNEMCRVAKKNILVVLPSEFGDETKMLKIKFPEKFEQRKARRMNIKKWISKNGFKVKEKRKLLRFLFHNLEETIEIFLAISFGSKLTKKEKLRLIKFLLNRKKKDGIHFTQGASFICGYK